MTELTGGQRMLHEDALIHGHIEPSPKTPLEAILAREGEVDPDWLAKMMELQERYERNYAAQKFAAAKSKFQAKCPVIKKNRQIDLGGGKGPRYADYADIKRVIGPLMVECELDASYSANMTEDGRLHMVCSLRHGMHVEISEVTLPVPAQLRVNDTQKLGAAMSFGKRYALSNALDLTFEDEDTDAHGLVETISEEQLATVKELIESSGADLKRFLKWAAIEQLKDMSQDFYPAAVSELKRKAKR